MIKHLAIKNFKLYKEVNLPLNRLNLLTGINGRGKSTVLQAFLLMSQSAQINRATAQIYLNGDDVKLGTFDDVKSKEVSFSEPICFTFHYDEIVCRYFLYSNQTDASELNIDKIVVESPGFELGLRKSEMGDDLYQFYSSTHPQINKKVLLPLFDLFLSNSTIEHYLPQASLREIRNVINLVGIHYVSADRIGPRIYYENKSLGHFIRVAALGENTVNVLYHKGNDHVNDTILRGYCKIFGEDYKEMSSTIEDNTNYWVDKIFQGAQVKVESIKGEDLLKLRIKSDKKGAYYKPTNVGYGFSYSLSIIVAGLIAKPGEILIVENPEAHLHPYAQSIMAKFLSLVASTGVQVFVESHSDHILNGFRIAVKNKIIDSTHLNVLYFDHRLDNFFEKIDVDEDGGIDKWPISFFDQSVNDLNYLLGI